MLVIMGHSRADVVAAALRVLDEHGLEFCSMRRVAAALDVQPSALYHHVPDKQTLLALMADEVLREVMATPRDGVPGGGESGGALGGGVHSAESLCRALRGAMLAVRDGAELVATASAYRLGASDIEAGLAALLGGELLEGESGKGANPVDPLDEYRNVGTAGNAGATPAAEAGADGARTLLHFVFGHTQATQMQLQAQEFTALAAGRPADAAAEPQGTTRAALEASFDRGVAIILAGVEATVAAEASRRIEH